MGPTVRCGARQGLRHQCGLAALHEGDHRSGDRSWARGPRDQAAYERQLEELRVLRDQAIGWTQRAEG
ncbi:hypothetical protein ACUN7V_01340 [Quadrisphaera oryzae]|uniref:hypothetical protein n=1 Tax=Quadrisphaera TaxID=317661 RepID=UPI001648059A|nr:hypothetical protein [Quadrisphaera sp. RL12-1S]MBC3762672.1 hypothetical protein [Quadrisphaera sp. RL12-1S]